jgi:hypothetical protein
VDNEARIIDTEQAVRYAGVLDRSISTNFNETAGGDLAVKKTERVDEKGLGAVRFVDLGG